MTFTVRETFIMSIYLVTMAALIQMSILFAHQSRLEELRQHEINNALSVMSNERTWRRYEGDVIAADIVDILVRYRHTANIVIRDNSLTSNSFVAPYLIDGALVLGLRAERNIPERFWQMTHLFNAVFGGDGRRRFTGTLLYDGQTEPLFAENEQVRGSYITGVEFRRR